MKPYLFSSIKKTKPIGKMRCCTRPDELLRASHRGRRSSIDTIEKLELASSKDVELVQIQVLFRHGSRTPFSFSSALPEATYDRNMSFDLPETVVPCHVVNIITGKSVGPSPMEQDFKNTRLKGGCKPAILTTVGQKEMLNLGRKIRASYLEPLKITSHNPEFVRIRSSNIERTVKSLRCVMVGVFGRLNLANLGPLKIPVKDIWDEDIFPNKLSCPSLRVAVNMTLAGLDSFGDYNQAKRTLLAVLGNPIGNLDFSSIKDDTSARLAHGKPYPTALEPFKEMIEKQSARVLRALTSGRVEGLPQRDDVLMMSIGRLLYTLIAQMDGVVLGVSKARMCLYSGHDTTITPILEVLGVKDARWPPFGASIVLELYKTRDSSSDLKFYVRAIYCWNVLTLPCYNEPLVPFAIFRRMLARYALTQAEYRRMCGTTPRSLKL